MRAAAFFETGPDAEVTYAEVPTPAVWDFDLPWVLGAEFAEAGGEVTSVGIGDLVTALRSRAGSAWSAPPGTW